MKKTSLKPRREVQLIDVALLFRTNSGGSAAPALARVVACTRGLYDTLKTRMSPLELYRALGYGPKVGEDSDDEIAESLQMFEETLADVEALTEPYWHHSLPSQFSV